MVNRPSYVLSFRIVLHQHHHSVLSSSYLFLALFMLDTRRLAMWMQSFAQIAYSKWLPSIADEIFEGYRAEIMIWRTCHPRVLARSEAHHPVMHTWHMILSARTLDEGYLKASFDPLLSLLTWDNRLTSLKSVATLTKVRPPYTPLPLSAPSIILCCLLSLFLSPSASPFSC